MPPPLRQGALSTDGRLTSDVCLSVAYIGPNLGPMYATDRHENLRTGRPRKSKIDREVGHITCDSDTTFKVKGSKINLQGAGYIVTASRTACYSNIAV